MKIVCALILLFSAQLCLAFSIEVKMLAQGFAVLEVDGVRRSLREGTRSPEGILLVSANGKQAVIELDGKKRNLELSKQISTQFKAAGKTEIRIATSEGGHYRTKGLINGMPVNFFVDTGATTIAMNYREAERLGLDYRAGVEVSVSTANGLARAFSVTLNSVSVGNIVVHQVQALVSTTESPTEILLGNSYLSKVNLQIEQGVLVLKEK